MIMKTSVFRSQDLNFFKYLKMVFSLSIVLLVIGCKDVLYSDIPERDINMMVMILEKNGISARRQKDDENKYSIMVEGSDFSNAVKILASNGYPKKKFKTFGDIFSDDSIVKTPFEQRARFIHALNQELSRSLSEIDGVVSARVHVMIPEKSRFGTAKDQASAAVMILHNKDKDMKRLTPKIKQFVAHSVSGVSYQSVSVVMMPAGQTVQEPSSNEPLQAGGMNFTNMYYKSNPAFAAQGQREFTARDDVAVSYTDFQSARPASQGYSLQFIALISVFAAFFCLLAAFYFKPKKS